MSVIELVNIDESSHEESIVIFITKTDLNTKKSATEYDDLNCFYVYYSERNIFNYTTIFMVSW